MTSPAEENYLKAIFKISEKDKRAAATNALANHLSTSAASVTDMLKRLADKELINYEKYKGVTLSSEGNKVATSLIRRHRLWEVFLVEKLRFSWHQVHDIAEDLEHINSDELIMRLDAYLNYPKFDPHGDPIPNVDGKFTLRNQVQLTDLTIGQTGILVGVRESGTEFLQYLNHLKINLGTPIGILEKIKFDQSLKIIINDKEQTIISDYTAQQLLIRKN